MRSLLPVPLRLAIGAAALFGVIFAPNLGATTPMSFARQTQTADVIRVGLQFSVNTLDNSHVSGGALPWVSSMGLETLMQINPRTKALTGLLAQSVTNPGRGVYVYHLRHGVKFWDGNEMTATDVANSLNYYRDPHSQLSFYYKTVKSIVAKDKYTVVVTLKRPDATWRYIPASTQSPIFEKKFQDAHKTTMGQPGTLEMGTGPWKFDSLDPTKGAELSAWSGYWGPKAKIKRISFRFFADQTSMALAFRAGQIDLVPQVDDPRAWRATTGQQVTTVPGCGIQMFFMPTTTPPWNDIHVRRAVAYAMNRTEQIQAKGIPAVPVTTLILPVQLQRLVSKARVDAMIKKLPQYPFSLAKARAELAKSAYPKGFNASFPTIASFFGNDPQVVSAQLAKIGINLDVKIIPLPDWLDLVISKRSIEGITFAVCLTGDPSDYVTNYLGSSVVNAANYRPPAVEALIKQSVFYTSPEKRFAIYTKLLQHLNTDLPYVPLFSQQATMAISGKFTWPTFNSGWAFRDYVAEVKPK